MNISIFNKEYAVRRYTQDGGYEESTVSVHLHPQENGSGTPWAESQGIVRHISGHGMVPLREADMENGTRADRIFYMGRWYECTSSVLYDRTVLSHYNYQFIVVPEDAVETITIFNSALDEDKGYDVYVRTVIKGVSWIFSDGTTADNPGLKSASRFTVRVPEDADFSGKQYVDPASFNGADGTFTFMPGDIIVRGEEDEQDVPAGLLRKHRKIMKVMTVNDFRNAPNGRHWKLEGE